MDRASEEIVRTKLADSPKPDPEPKVEVVETKLKAAPQPRIGVEVKGGKAEHRATVEGKAADERKVSVCVRAADMPLPLQRRAVRIAVEAVAAMPRRLESKRLALALKKDFDTTYGPAWHCIVGTSFGSYVTHSMGGFLYFSVDKVYILLFRTAVEPLAYPQ